MYSPTAMERAPAAIPATPVEIMMEEALSNEALAVATPTIRDAVETRPSLIPRTAARSQPAR